MGRLPALPSPELPSAFLGLKAPWTRQLRSPSTLRMAQAYLFRHGHSHSTFQILSVRRPGNEHSRCTTRFLWVVFPSWPDGSLKWTGHALAASENLVDTFHLSVDTPTEPTVPVDVTQTSDQITVTTGSFTGTCSLMFKTLTQCSRVFVKPCSTPPALTSSIVFLWTAAQKLKQDNSWYTYRMGLTNQSSKVPVPRSSQRLGPSIP